MAEVSSLGKGDLTRVGMALFPRQMPALFEDDAPFTYPDGTPIPHGLTLMLACARHITASEARSLLIEAWRGGKDNRAQRRQRKKKCR